MIHKRLFSFIIAGVVYKLKNNKYGKTLSSWLLQEVLIKKVVVNRPYNTLFFGMGLSNPRLYRKSVKNW